MNLPNKLTMLRIILIPVFLVLVLVESIPMHYLWALLVYLIACFTDTLDGHIARSRGLVTDFGKLMDPLADKLLVMSALVAFIPVADVPVWVVVVILAREFMVTSLRLIAAGKGVVIAADKDVRYEDVVNVMKLLQSAEVERVGLSLKVERPTAAR